MVHVALLLLMLEAANANLVSTISLKRNTPTLQLSTTWPADYPILLRRCGHRRPGEERVARRTAQIRSRLITTPQRALIAVSLAIARHRSARRSLAHHPAWQAEHHEVGIVATEVIWPRRDRQAIREPAHSLVVHNATHLVGRQRDVVRPLAAQVCKVDLALARHRRCTAISRQASTCTPSFT